MGQKLTIAVPAAVRSDTMEKAAAIPWYGWTSLLASACLVIGGIWDVSWHMSTGRDQILVAPTHRRSVLCYGALFDLRNPDLGNNLDRDAVAKEASVGVLGFCGPHG